MRVSSFPPTCADLGQAHPEPPTAVPRRIIPKQPATALLATRTHMAQTMQQGTRIRLSRSSIPKTQITVILPRTILQAPLDILSSRALPQVMVRFPLIKRRRNSKILVPISRHQIKQRLRMNQKHHPSEQSQQKTQLDQPKLLIRVSSLISSRTLLTIAEFRRLRDVQEIRRFFRSGRVRCPAASMHSVNGVGSLMIVFLV